MKKAKYKGKIRNKNGTTDLFYEYRGREYMITDYGWTWHTNLAEQHATEQRRIDRIIEEENRPHAEWKYEGSAEEALDIFMRYVESGE